MIGGGDTFVPEILDQSDRVGAVIALILRFFYRIWQIFRLIISQCLKDL